MRWTNAGCVGHAVEVIDHVNPRRLLGYAVLIVAIVELFAVSILGWPAVEEVGRVLLVVAGCLLLASAWWLLERMPAPREPPLEN